MSSNASAAWASRASRLSGVIVGLLSARAGGRGLAPERPPGRQHGIRGQQRHGAIVVFLDQVLIIALAIVAAMALVGNGGVAVEMAAGPASVGTVGDREAHRFSLLAVGTEIQRKTIMPAGVERQNLIVDINDLTGKLPRGRAQAGDPGVTTE